MTTPPPTPAAPQGAFPDDPAEHRAAGSASPGATPHNANRYVARILQQHLVDDPETRHWVANGTAAFVDVSGFTQLSERLARKGREGAEQISDIINGSFEAVLAAAYARGGSLLKFGGDALLLWFEGAAHAERACRAAIHMRQALADVGRIDLPDSQVTLRMAQGVHSGDFQFFAVGSAHVELLTTGPGWSRLVAIQHEAGADEIRVSAETAAAIAPECAGEASGESRVLRCEPPGEAATLPLVPRPAMSAEAVAHCLPRAIRSHVAAGGGMPEHRPVTVAFIRFSGIDALVESGGSAAAGEALHQLLQVVEAAADEQDVAFLASDVDSDGGKLILAAGAPRVTGDDERRMLLALRRVVDGKLPLAVRAGVHRAAVFAGDIGPAYRRTYTVMGDAVNLAARLMARAEPGSVYATSDVLDRSDTHFETTKLEPFAVKGKAEPVQAWSVGRAQASKTRQMTLEKLPLTGRNAELGVIRKAFTSARSGAGRLIEIVGEAGMGKTRLLEALRDAATGLHKSHAACEAYTGATPYALWRELLRELMAFGRDATDEEVVDRLRETVTARMPELAPWLPLVAIAFGVEAPPTPEVDMLAEANRRAKLHESLARFLAATMAEPRLIEIENAHHMDGASAELLAHLVGELGSKPWLFAVARRPSAGGFSAPDADSVVRIELRPLALPDALRLAQLATQKSPLPPHALDVVAQRSGGNPQFLRDLLRMAIESGGVENLPDSAEAAAMARIDGLSAGDRAVVRRASVLGLTFHPRMLRWFADDEEFPPPDPDVWSRLRELFDEEPDGYLRFRRALLRDAAYEGLPFKLRRKLHGAVATHLEHELDHPEEAAGTLSMHYFEAGEYEPASRYASVAARRAEGDYAYVEAAKLYARALDAGRQLEHLGRGELADLHRAIGDSWYRAAEFSKASAAYTATRPLLESDPLADAGLLIKLSLVEDKLGKYSEALRLTQQALDVFRGLPGPESARQAARSSAWYATLLQYEGRVAEALEWAERAIAAAEAANDPEALGGAYFVMGAAHGELGKPDAQALMQRSLEAFERAGNLSRQAGVLSDLGLICRLECRWDEALHYYERAREAALKVGSTVNATNARMNAAEVLADRGEWTEAETLLQEALRVWKAVQVYQYLGECRSWLGQVSLRLGRFDEALGHLEEARASFLRVGADEEIPGVDARIADCRLAMGNPDGALELVRGMLGRASESNGVARVVPLLERLQGHALLQQGDLWGARDALDASLAAARERRDPFEAALAMLSLIELDRLEGVEPPLDMVEESRSILGTLKVRAVPPVPRPPA